MYLAFRIGTLKDTSRVPKQVGSDFKRRDGGAKPTTGHMTVGEGVLDEISARKFG